MVYLKLQIRPKGGRIFLKMLEIHSLSSKEIQTHFTPEKGWKIVEISAEELDIHEVQKGSKIRCIDKRNGMTPEGYRFEEVALAPAWLGAADGIAAFYSGNAELRMSQTVQAIRASGFEPAVHGDYLKGDEGCAFRRALVKQLLPDLETITQAEWRLLRVKLGIHYTDLFEPVNQNLGFAVNDQEGVTIFPEGGKYYPVDLWYPIMLGVNRKRALSAIAVCGELLLPIEHRTLFVYRH